MSTILSTILRKSLKSHDPRPECSALRLIHELNTAIFKSLRAAQLLVADLSKRPGFPYRIEFSHHGKRMARSLKYKITKELRDDIILGKLMPGERVKEAPLTQRFKCSRGPVREALNQLEKEGFVQLIPNQGAIITKMSPEEVKDYYALLEMLEGKAVEWAVPFLEEKDLRKLKELNEDIKGISHEDMKAIEKWVPLNLEFHRLFRAKCGNDKLNWMIEEIRMRINRYRYMSLILTAFDEYTLDHEKIIEAASQGDAAKASDLMRGHIEHAKNVLVDFLSRSQGF